MNLTTENKDKLRKAIREINDSMVRTAAERDLQKEIIKDASENIGLDKKIIRRMAKVYYNANFANEVEENRTFEETYGEVLR